MTMKVAVALVMLLSITYFPNSESANEKLFGIDCEYEDSEWSGCFLGKAFRVRKRVSGFFCRFLKIEIEDCEDLNIPCGISTITPASNHLHQRSDDPQYIVGGEDATECEFPWVVYLKIGFYKCGGAIIDKQHILTAAHCIDGQFPAFTIVRVGEHDLNDDSANQHSFRARDFRVHPGYDKNGAELHDIALIEIWGSIEFNSCAQPICFPSVDQVWETGTECIVAGWGTTEEDGSGSDILQKVAVQTWTYEDCIEEFPDNEDYVNWTEFCAGVEGGGKDACQGDSGGPLMCAFEGKWYVAGVVSSGLGCARDGHPGAYTEVSQYTEWILKNI